MVEFPLSCLIAGRYTGQTFLNLCNPSTIRTLESIIRFTTPVILEVDTWIMIKKCGVGNSLWISFFFWSLMCILPALDFERRKEKTGCEALSNHATCTSSPKQLELSFITCTISLWCRQISHSIGVTWFRIMFSNYHVSKMEIIC